MKLKSTISGLMIVLSMTVFAQEEKLVPQPSVQAILDNVKMDGPVTQDQWPDELKEAISIGEENFPNKYNGYNWGDQKLAEEKWRYIFFNAPCARQTTFYNGSKYIFKDKAKAAKETPEKQQLYVDSLLAVYFVKMECNGEDAGSLVSIALTLYQYRNSDHPGCI